MLYSSTRSNDKSINSSGAIIKGIADDGGLFVPSEIPQINEKLENLTQMNYKELAFFIMSKYFSDFKEDDLKKCIENAYDSKFHSTDIVPLVEKGGVHFLELYHGPTLAFKDMALSILPHLLNTAIRVEGVKREIVILTATSGDTGKAALEGFANIDGIKIIVFFPKNGVSEIQKLQMITQEGENTFVVGIDGNFDDAQNGVKNIFNDREFCRNLYEKGYMLSSANSINIGRLVPQVVYYFYGYLNLLKSKKISNGESINVVVPTGNFGNILAAYYAKKMGLPIKKLICASNENNVLSDFFNEGVYDKKRELKLTSSPSMDILISSNLERLLFELSGRDCILISNLMKKLQDEGKYEITENMKSELNEFYGDYATESETFDSIRNFYNATGYVMDTHTAVAYSVYEKYKLATGDSTEAIIVSTASPFKFAKSVCNAMGISANSFNDFHAIEELACKTQLHIPDQIKELQNKSIIHNNHYKKDEIELAVKKFLKV